MPDVLGRPGGADLGRGQRAGREARATPTRWPSSTGSRRRTPSSTAASAAIASDETTSQVLAASTELEARLAAKNQRLEKLRKQAARARGRQRGGSVVSGASKVVIVAGAGRSGTSTVAGALTMLGLHLPEPEVPADETNPRGFYESQWVVDFHKELLNRSPVVRTLDSRPEAPQLAQALPTPADRARLDAWLGEAARAPAGAGQGPARVLVPRPVARRGHRARRRARVPHDAAPPGRGREVARHPLHADQSGRELPPPAGHRQHRRLGARLPRHRAGDPRRPAGLRPLRRPARRLARRALGRRRPASGSTSTSTATATSSTTSSSRRCGARRPPGTPSTSPTPCVPSPRAPGSR